MSVRFDVRTTDIATVVVATGRVVQGASGPTIQQTVRELVRSGQTNIILNLSGVSYMDSSGLGDLVGTYAATVSRGGHIALLGLNDKVYELMQITKLYTVFSIYTDEASALRSFESVVPSAS